MILFYSKKRASRPTYLKALQKNYFQLIQSLKKEFDSIKKSNDKFAQSNYAQLKWLHDRSPNYEKAHLTYPIYKVHYND